MLQFGDDGIFIILMGIVITHWDIGATNTYVIQRQSKDIATLAGSEAFPSKWRDERSNPCFKYSLFKVGAGTRDATQIGMDLRPPPLQSGSNT